MRVDPSAKAAQTRTLLQWRYCVLSPRAIETIESAPLSVERTSVPGGEWRGRVVAAAPAYSNAALSAFGAGHFLEAYVLARSVVEWSAGRRGPRGHESDRVGARPGDGADCPSGRGTPPVQEAWLPGPVEPDEPLTHLDSLAADVESLNTSFRCDTAEAFRIWRYGARDLLHRRGSGAPAVCDVGQAAFRRSRPTVEKMPSP